MFSFCSVDHCVGLVPREALSTPLKETQYPFVVGTLMLTNSYREQAHAAYPGGCDSVCLVGVTQPWNWELESTFPNHMDFELAKNDSVRSRNALSMNAHSAGRS